MIRNGTQRGTKAIAGRTALALALTASASVPALLDARPAAAAPGDGQIHLVVDVIGGSAAPGAFVLNAVSTVDGGDVVSGRSGVTGLVAAGSYQLSSSGPTGYVSTLECLDSSGVGKSTAGNVVMVAADEEVRCEFAMTRSTTASLDVGVAITAGQDVVPAGASVGDEIVVVETVTNTTAVTAPAVRRATSPGEDFTCMVDDVAVDLPADLEAGVSLRCISARSLTAGDITNTAVRHVGEFCTTAGCQAALVRVGLSGSPARPALALNAGVKTVGDADGIVELGETVTWNVTVTNTGNGPLDDAHVSVVGGVAAVRCAWPASFGELKPGQAATCTSASVVTQADINATSIAANFAVCADAPDGLDAGAAPDAVEVCATDAAAVAIPRRLAAAAAVTASNIVDTDENGHDAGDRVDYRIVVTNRSSTAAVLEAAGANFVVDSCDPAAGTAIEPAGSTTCQAHTEVTQADADAGAVQRTITGCAAAGAESACVSAATQTRFEQRPDVSAAMAASAVVDRDGNGADAGDVIDYEVTVTNEGNVSAPLSVSDVLLGIEFSCLPAGRVRVAPGGSIVCAGRHAVTQANVDAGGVTSRANGCLAFGATPLCQAVSVTTVIDARFATLTARTPSVVVDLDGNGADAGDRIDYTVTVVNVGNVRAGLVVSDTRLSDLTCQPVAGSMIAPGGSMTCSGSAIVSQADVDAGAQGGQATGCVAATSVCSTAESEAVIQPNAAVRLAHAAAPLVDLDGNGHDAGDTIDYTISVRNAGNVSASFTATSSALGTLTCTPAASKRLAPGDVMECIGTYTLTQADLDEGAKAAIATACVSGTETCATAQAVTTLVRRVTVSVSVASSAVLDADANGIDPGDQVELTVTARNTGNATASLRVALTGPRAAALALALACAPDAAVPVAPGSARTCTARHAVTQADIDAGRVSVRATACSLVAGAAEVCGVRDHSRAVPQSPMLGTEMTVDGARSKRLAPTGGRVTFAIVVTNRGNVTLRDLEVSDPRVPACEFVARSLAVGASARHTCVRAVTSDLMNVATATARVPGGVDPTPSAAQAFVDVRPALSLSQVANPARPTLSGAAATTQITYVLTNRSTEVVRSVSLVDSVFGNIGAAVRTSTTGVDVNGTLRWSVTDDRCAVPAALNPNQSYTCRITVRFTVDLTTPSLPTHSSVATAKATDNEANVAAASQATVVSFTWSARQTAGWTRGAWPAPYARATTVQRVFTIPACLKNGRGNLDLGARSGSGAPDTLAAALAYRGGATMAGGAELLLRAATTALLNEARYGAAYPAAASTAELVGGVNSVLASCDRATMVARAAMLDGWNAAPR